MAAVAMPALPGAPDIEVDGGEPVPPPLEPKSHAAPPEPEADVEAQPSFATATQSRSVATQSRSVGHARSSKRARMSLASAYDAAYIVTDDEAAKFRRNSTMVSFAYALLTSSFVVIGVTMPYSFHYIINGGAERVSPESSAFLSLAISVQLAVGIAVQEMWGKSGGWWGRQKTLAAISALQMVAQALGLVAHVSKTAELWILSSVFNGLASASFASASAYCADMSTEENFAKTTGLLFAMSTFGVVLGFVIQAGLGKNMLIALLISNCFVLVSAIMFSCILPDASPPKEKRTRPSKVDIGLSLLVCRAGKSFLEQTRYTKCLLMSMVFGGASFSCLRIWLFGFALKNFGMGVVSISILLLGWMLGTGIITLAGTRCIPAKVGCNLTFWMQILFSVVASFGPGKSVTMVIAAAVGLMDGLSASFLNTMFFGQLSGKRRGELSALHSLADKLGGLLGLFVITPVNVLWLQSYATTGEGIAFNPPMVQLVFDGLSALLYYLAQLCLRHQDKYGLFVLRTSEEVPDEHKCGSKEEGEGPEALR